MYHAHEIPQDLTLRIKKIVASIKGQSLPGPEVDLAQVQTDVDKLIRIVDWTFDRIAVLEEDLREAESGLDYLEEKVEDVERLNVELNGLPDQLKLEHLQNIFSQYSLAEIEAALPIR